MMECLRGLSLAPPRVIAQQPSACAVAPKRRVWLSAQLSDYNDPLLRSAIEAASLRFLESQRADPLFIDPYAGCFIPPDIRTHPETYTHHYCLETKFIDIKLLDTVNRIDGSKQVVLLTGGMDTRPYRLNWPPSTMIFDVSPESVFRTSAEKLEGVGAKVPRNCLFFHIPLESPNIQQSLRSKGFSGNRPSVWAIQGLPFVNMAHFEEILYVVSCLAMNESLLLGELPSWLAETDMGSKSDMKKWVEKLFTSNGFRVEIINYSDIASNFEIELAPGEHKKVLFIAQHLRFSDDQMEAWRREFQRIEDEGDEEGFEEL